MRLSEHLPWGQAGSTAIVPKPINCAVPVTPVPLAQPLRFRDIPSGPEEYQKKGQGL